MKIFRILGAILSIHSMLWTSSPLMANESTIRDTVDYRELVYQGQEKDSIELQSKKVKITYVDEQYQTTCTRKVPYEDTVCENVTKYRRQCTTVPAHQECTQVPRQSCQTVMEQECTQVPHQTCRDYTTQVCSTSHSQQCRSVTRHRQQCRSVPGRQVCRDVTDGETCTTRNERVCRTGRSGRQVCRDVPRRVCRGGQTRRVCRQTNSRQECRQVPYTTNECTSVPRRSCRNVTRNRCDTTYTTQCTTVPRQRCTTSYETQCTMVPDREECTNVPYTERVCRQVTRHRTEQYSCTRTRKVPKKEVLSTTNGKIDVNFKSLGIIDAASTASIMGNLQGQKLWFKTRHSNDILLLGKKDPTSTKLHIIQDVTVANLKQLLAPLKAKYNDFSLKKKHIKFSMDKVGLLTQNIQMELKVVKKKKQKLIFNGPITSEMLSMNEEDGKTMFDIDLSEYKLNKSLIGRKLYDVKLVIKVNFEGDIMKEGVELGNLTRTIKFEL